MKIFFIALQGEAEHIINKLKLYKHTDNYYFGNDTKLFITGYGYLSVYKTLLKYKNLIPDDAIYYNIGYAGSKNLEKNKLYEVSKVIKNEHSNIIAEKDIKLDTLTDYDKCICSTSNNFVTHSNSDDEVLYDMELWYLASIYPNINAFKFISDHLNWLQFKNKNKTNYEQSIEKLLWQIEKIT